MVKFITLKSVLFTALLLCGANIFATTLLVEDFEYPIGNSIINYNWAGYDYSTQSATVTNGLIFTNYAGSDVGGAVELGHAKLARTFPTQTSGTVYLAFLLKTSSSTQSLPFIGLSATPTTTVIPTVIKTQFGTKSTDGKKVGFSSSNTITPNSTALVVIKYDFSSSKSNLYILDSYLATEPVTPTETISESITSIGAVCFIDNGLSVGVTIDGIRVATTWAEACAVADGGDDGGDDGGGDDGGDGDGDGDTGSDDVLPLLIENFDYPFGDDIRNHNWVNYDYASTSTTITNNRLNFTGYAGSDVGGAISLGNAKIARTFPAQTSGTVYLAFLLKTSPSTPIGNFIGLSASTATAATTIAKLATGSPDGSKIGFNMVPNNITPNVPTLIVIKYDFSEHKSSLFILNSYSATEPTNPVQEISETATSIGSVCLIDNGASAGVIIDDIRVATTWEAACAATSTWKGAAGTAWATEANWDIKVPSVTDRVIIPADLSNYPVIPDATKVEKITFKQGAGATLAGSFTATESIQVDYTVAQDKWYAIGFPFAINQIYSHYFAAQAWEPTLVPDIPGNVGDYYLRSYGGSTFTPVTTAGLTANAAYIIRFPYWQDGEKISFISGPVTLQSLGSSLAVGDDYTLVANPSLNTLNLDAADANYYVLNDAGTLFDLVLDTNPLNAFEAAITIEKGVQGAPAHIDITGELTGFENPRVNDPAVSVRYYNLQGVEIYSPASGGVFIEKTIHQSGAVSVSKIIKK